jgi:hypothetical protein
MNDSVYLVGCSASNFTGSAYHCSRGPRDARPTRQSSFRLLAMASPHMMLFGSDCYNHVLYHARKGHTVGLECSRVARRDRRADALRSHDREPVTRQTLRIR